MVDLDLISYVTDVIFSFQQVGTIISLEEELQEECEQ